MERPTIRLWATEVAILRALRSGPRNGVQIEQQIGRMPGESMGRLIRFGYVTHQLVDGAKRLCLYTITPAGREACPPRNPASLKPRNIPRQGDNVRGPTIDRGNWIGVRVES